MEQETLWAAPDRPKLIVATFERCWVDGEDCFALRMSTKGSKTKEAVWMNTQHLQGRHAAQVASRIVEAAFLRFDSSNWASKPAIQAQERWESHLHTF